MKIINKLPALRPCTIGDVIISYTGVYHIIVYHDDTYYSLNLETMRVDLDEPASSIDELLEQFGASASVVPKEMLSLTLG